jgi:hypothetical protein
MDPRDLPRLHGRRQSASSPSIISAVASLSVDWRLCRRGAGVDSAEGFGCMSAERIDASGGAKLFQSCDIVINNSHLLSTSTADAVVFVINAVSALSYLATFLS